MLVLSSLGFNYDDNFLKGPITFMNEYSLVRTWAQYLLSKKDPPLCWNAEKSPQDEGGQWGKRKEM